MKIDLAGRLAVVTGASGELGRVMANVVALLASDLASFVTAERTCPSAAGMPAI